MTAAGSWLACDGCGRTVAWQPGPQLPAGWRGIAEQDHACPDCCAPMDQRPTNRGAHAMAHAVHDDQGTTVPPPPRTETDAEGRALGPAPDCGPYLDRTLRTGDRLRREHKLDPGA